MPGARMGTEGLAGRTLTEPGQLPLSNRARRRAERAAEVYPMRVPPTLARLADWSNPRCPIRRQLLPDPRELEAGGELDPLDEGRHEIAPAVLRRFPDRLLALVSSTCPVLCRHCNRKRIWSKPVAPAGPDGVGAALAKAGRRIKEVILSGGEPLLQSDAAIGRLLEAARSRPGVELVRIHTRAPVALPERISAGLVRVLRRHEPLWVVTHFNAAAELGPEARAALARLRGAGIPVLNQAVLLKGVNDSTRAQAALGRALVAQGVRPYYLFQLDRAAGTLHFQVPLKRGLAIVGGLRAKHSGLLVPHYMGDLPGRGGKVPLTPDAVVRFTRSGTWLRGADGRRVFYPEPAGMGRG